MPVKLQNTIRYPTSLLVRGADFLGIEIAKSLLEQGGFVIIVDHETKTTKDLFEELRDYKLFTLLDFDSLHTLEEDLRRLDYVFYLEHQSKDLSHKVSSQEFLQASNYLDAVLDLSAKFEAKFLLTTSITAHQLNVASEDLRVSYNFESEDRHKVYTDYEIQRYSESLVKEYEDKVGINSRIVRIGEILGKGIEISSDSKLIDLMIQAVQGKNLVIPGDGLDSAYYVHYLDAAYGILKAQFSNNTKDKIFTLANDEEITLLSIAYKLFDLSPDVKEIVFDSNNNSLPPIKLYKPAPNLETIGWKPRVSFERSLSQSLEYINRALAGGELDQVETIEDVPETNEAPPLKKKSIFEKIRDFFFVVETKEIENKVPESNDADLEGALSRLVQERKNQEKARKGSIVLANEKLRNRVKPYQEKTFVQKATYVMDDLFIGLKKRFRFLRYITLKQFIVMSLIGAAFMVVYFILLAPGLSLVKNVYLINQDLETLNTSIDEFDIQSSKVVTESIKSNLVESQERLLELKFIFDLLQRDQLYLDLQHLLSNSIQYINGFDEVLGALQPFDDYLAEFDPQIIYRFSDANTLSSNSLNTHEALIELIRDNGSQLRIGIDRISKARIDIDTYMATMPDWIQQNIGAKLEMVDTHFEEFDYLQNAYAVLPTMLGNDGASQYLILIQDNARYTAAGGEIVGFIEFKVENGDIRDINIKTIDAYEPGLDNVSTELLAEINLLSNKDVSRSNIEIKDLSLIGDQDLLLKSAIQLYESRENKEIDMAMTINLNILSELLQSSGSVQYNQLNFTKETLLSNLNLLVGDAENSVARNEAIVNVYSQVIERNINNLDENFVGLMRILANSRNIGEFNIYSEDINYKNYITVTDPTQFISQDFVAVGLNYDQEQVIINKYPILTVDITVSVASDLTTTKQVELSASGVESMQNAYLCAPNGSRNFEFSDITQDLYTSTFSTDKVCTIFLEDDNLKYGVNYETIVLEVDGGNNFNFELVGNPGVIANYDVEFVFAEGLNPTPNDQKFLRQGNNFVYSGTLSGNKTFSFDLSN